MHLKGPGEFFFTIEGAHEAINWTRIEGRIHFHAGLEGDVGLDAGNSGSIIGLVVPDRVGSIPIALEDEFQGGASALVVHRGDNSGLVYSLQLVDGDHSVQRRTIIRV